MGDSVLINKAAIIERCLQRIDEEYQGAQHFSDLSFTKQDSIILNLERACEAAVSIGVRLVKKKNLGVPQDKRDVFHILQRAKIMTVAHVKHLQSMIGFRNIAVHDYQSLNLDIVEQILREHLGDLKKMARLSLRWAKK